MAITLTGSKASGTLSAVGTYSVTVGTTPFSSGDYSVSRYAVLFTSAGVFKGIARVRRYVSTSSLDLMTEFYDPVDGTSVTQVVGDLVHISKNFSECVTTGLTYSAGSVTATDQLVFGTAGSQTSLVLHDESCQVLSTYSGAAACDFFGGVCIFGHQAYPGASDVVGACTFVANTAYASPYTVLQVSNAAVNLFCFGGGVGKVVATTVTVLHITVNVSPYSFVFVSATIPSIATYAGSATVRHVLQNCGFEQVKTAQVLIRWKTGIISGGYARVNPGFASYSVFGEDAAGTYSRNSDPNKRFVVVDSSATYPMVRSATAASQTWTFTNAIAVSKRHVYSTSTPNPNGTGLYYYRDTYTNVVSGSVAQVRLDSDSSLESSTLGTGATWSPSVLRDSWTGATQNAGFPHGPWTYGIKRYGYAPVSGAIAASTYDLGAAGTADNVAFGGAVVQAPDTSVTLSESAALALTAIGTYDDLYDALIAWGCASVANAAYPSLGAYPCASGGGIIDLGALDLVVDATAASAIAVNTGSHVVTIKSAALAAGSKHSSLTTTGTVSTANGASITGVYTDATGTSAVLTLAGLQDASVLLVDGSGTTVEFQAAQSGEFDYVYNFAPGATGTWKWVAKAPGREHATGTFTPGAGGAFSYAPVLTQKLTPSGDPMYTGTTSALVSVSIPGTTNAYIDIGDGTAPLQEAFNETELALVTQAGLEWIAAGKDDVSVFDSGSGDYLFLTAGWRLRRASAGDANAAIEAYVTSADGAIVDDTNGPVLYLTSNTPAAIAAAVWTYIDRELTQAIPTALQNAAAVRTELATELARLDVAVSTRATPVTVPTAEQNADALLGRNLAGGSDGGRTVRDALRASRNKSAISGSTLTVYQEDDATPAWTAAVSTAERDALQSIDPA